MGDVEDLKHVGSGTSGAQGVVWQPAQRAPWAQQAWGTRERLEFPANALAAHNFHPSGKK